MLLDIWSMVTAHGALIVFAGLTFGLDIVRGSLQHRGEQVWTGLALVFEWLTGVTMVAPRALRAARDIVFGLRDVLVAIAIAGHDVYYSLKHGSRRPPKGPSSP